MDVSTPKSDTSIRALGGDDVPGAFQGFASASLLWLFEISCIYGSESLKWRQKSNLNCNINIESKTVVFVTVVLFNISIGLLRYAI